MNKRHYEHTLPNIRGSLSNTYIQFQFGIPFHRFRDQPGLLTTSLLLLLTITAHRFPDPPSVNQHKRQKGNIQHQYRQRSVNQQSCRHP